MEQPATGNASEQHNPSSARADAESTSLRVLILEDVPTDAELMEHQLRRTGIAFTSLRVDTREAFVRALEEFRPDVVLADYRLPTFDGREAVRIVRGAHPEVPVIIVTGTLGDEPAVELLKEGARDYVLKGNLGRLPFAVQRALSEERSIRARKAAEQALRDSEEKLRSIAELAHDAVIMLDDRGQVAFWNEGAEHLLGYTAAELAGRDFHLLAAPERYHTDYRQGFPGFVATGEGPVIGKTIELAVRRKDGTESPVELSVSAVRLAGRWHAIGIMRDITERKCAEKELEGYRAHLEELVQSRTAELSEANRYLEKEVAKRRRSQARLSKVAQRLKYLVTASPAVIYSCKPGGNRAATFVSPNVRQLLGYEPGEFTEDPGFWASRIHPEDVPQALEGKRRFVKKGGTCLEYRFRRKDGGYRWLRDEMKLTLDEEGRPLEAVGYLTDITAHKDADRLKDELVSTVSHELRTPLASLRGFVELLLTRNFPPEKERQFLGIIDEETKRLNHLIDDFLDIQRIESGRQEYHFSSLDVLALLQGIGELFAEASGKHTLRVEAPAMLRPVRGDEERIRQVLENLLSNAIKFSPDGGEILLRASAAGEEIEVSVTDHGIGIPAEEIPKLFQKFYRVEHPGMPHLPGTGLGLALVREIVQKHGGRVWAESEPGRGSTFHFTLMPADGDAQA